MEQIHTFFVRISATCNLNCDYCYVFKKADTTWRNLPPVMSDETISMFAKRLRSYLLNNNIKKVNIVFHGGEPLILGENKFIKYSDILFEAVHDIADIVQSLQTNGTLISESLLKECEARKICFSVSLDGNKTTHDLHRKNKNGQGSFDEVMAGIKKLKKYPNIFSGVIGVINPLISPSEILTFYEANGIDSIDLLLPDSNFNNPPLYKSENSDIYSQWLISAFDEWFEHHQGISFRTFEVLLNNMIGNNASSDTFGLGYLDYLTIETDGSYHTSDILKSTYNNASSLGMNMFDFSIEEALKHKKITQYNTLLSYDSLPARCKLCEFVRFCGGGSLPHRYSFENGFTNPSIYCEELKALISHVQKRLSNEIERELANE